MSKTLNMVGGGAKGLFASILATGVAQEDTVTLTTPSGKVKSGKWASRPNPAAHGLPSEYQEVEYLESHGTEHIVTNLVLPNNYCKIISKNIFTGIKNNGSVHNVWFGAAKDSSAKFGIHYQVGYSYLVSNLGSNNNVGHTSMVVPSIGGELDLEIVANNGQFSITQVADGVSTAVSGTYSGSVATPGYPLAIFCYNEVGSFNHHSAYKFKELIAYTSENSLGFHGIPCYRKSDKKPGMYDLVTGEFLTNAGTGEFAVGADVPASFDGFLFDKLGEIGTYTLTASNGEKTVSETVLVDVVAEYQIGIEYNKLYLYRNGDECEAVTGGWYAAAASSTPTGTKETDHLHLSNNNSYIAFATNNKISLQGYSKLCFLANAGTCRKDINGSANKLPETVSNFGNYRTKQYWTVLDSIDNQIIEIDISSSQDDNYYLWIYNSKDGGNGNFDIYKVWLE